MKPISKIYSLRKYKDSKKLHQKAWKLMSLFIRNRGAKDGANRCFTCGKWENIKDLDCGHYIHRDSLDFNEVNLQSQCTKCNRFLHGNSGVFAHNLIMTYGLQVYKELEGLRFREHYFSIKELEEIILKYDNVKGFTIKTVS